MLRETGTLPAQTQILVLGAGIAGHCAALAAADAGAEVLLLEKASQPGGSSAIAGGAFAFCGTDIQRDHNIDDDISNFRNDLMESGKGKNSPILVEAFLKSQLETYEQLRKWGVSFDLYLAPPPTISRAHITGTGKAVTTLHMAARVHTNIKYFSKSSAARLIRNPDTGRVDKAIIQFGDQMEVISVHGGIILATGGFSRSRELLQIYAPELVSAVNHGGVANTGDGLLMASDLGAGHADLGYVTGSFGAAIRNYPQRNEKANEVLPLLFSFLEGGILVNKDGHRFVDEGQSYKTLSAMGMQQPEGIGFQIFDQKLMNNSQDDSSVNNYLEGIVGGYIRKAESISALAKIMGIPAARLKETVERYNAAVAAGVDSDWGRTKTLLPIDTAPYYIAASTNALTSTYGGITANENMLVTDCFGEPIEGLYAAGEVVGGFHGAGYYSASSLSSSATFGRLAGLNAAKL